MFRSHIVPFIARARAPRDVEFRATARELARLLPKISPTGRRALVHLARCLADVEAERAREDGAQ